MNRLDEDPAERARTYIASFEGVIHKFIPVKGDSLVRSANVTRVLDTIRQYLQDAHYYLENGKPVTSLASIGYAEGLLDALTLLELSRKNSPE